MAARIGRRNVGVGGGHFYAWRALQGVGIDPERGVLRCPSSTTPRPPRSKSLINALDAEL